MCSAPPVPKSRAEVPGSTGSEARWDLLADPDRYRQPVAVMKRDGLLTEVDGELRAAADATGADSHRIDSEFADEVIIAVTFG